MQSIKTNIICKHYFSVAALKFILKEIGIQGPTEVYPSLHSILNTEDSSDTLFIIDVNLIAEPQSFTLEKVRKKYPSAIFIALSDKIIDTALTPYFSAILYQNDNEENTLNKLRGLVDSFDGSKSSASDEISEREKEIVKLVALGNTNKEISDLLNLSTHTVITHRKNISGKLGIKSIAGLTIYAIINGIITPDEI